VTNFFTAEELSSLDPHQIPKHLAIIPDGNRRWAKNLNLEKTDGHKRGADTVTDIVIAAKELGIKAITVYTFSTENWQRPAWEVSSLLYILDDRLKRELDHMKEQGIALHTIGDLSPFPVALQETLEHVREKTKDGQGIDFILALNYGGRDELRRALTAIVDGVVEGRIPKDSLSEKLISEHLDTAPFGDPDLIIRTSGEMRTSNFLLWQNCYSEFVLVDKFWPEFKPKDLLSALLTYQKRERRVGI
jgi:undecaprenyl diphosphate synthase